MDKSDKLAEYQSDFFILRTPLLPVEKLSDLHHGVILDDEPNALFLKIKRLFSSTPMQEAIYIASPVLYCELMKILNGDNVAKDAGKIMLSLYQYYNRMCNRCTPFGMFAGCNIGDISDKKTELHIWGTEKNSKYIRLDMDFLFSLANDIYNSQPKDLFKYYPNSSIYSIGKKLRYIETTLINNAKSYKITSIDDSKLLQYLLAFCIEGKAYQEILQFIIRFDIPLNNAQSYLDEIVNAQLLVHEMGPNATGKEYMYCLLDTMKNKKEINKEYNVLKEAINSLGSNEKLIPKLEKIKSNLLTISPKLNEAYLYQLDMTKTPRSCNLNKEILTKVKEAIVITAILNPTDLSKSRLELFKKAFEERFETAMVKLTDVLDVENGIDYHALHSQVGENINNFLERNPIQAYKFEKYLEAVKNNAIEIAIFEEEVGIFKKEIPFPDSFSAMITMSNQDPTTPGHQIWFKYAGGPSAANMMGRFCHANEELTKKVHELIEKEESLTGKTFAEIAHIPQARVGNVIARPHLTKYEIQFLSLTDIPSKNRIPINDLFLQLINGRLILFSKKLKREIVPRLTNAHNYSQNNLHIYHFLSTLKHQGFQSFTSWNWDFLTDREFLPRVKFKNTVLFPATWNLSKKHLLFTEKSDEQLAQNFSIFRKALKIPDVVSYIDGDSELLLDLRVMPSIKILEKAYKKRFKLQLCESFNIDGHTVVFDEHGSGYTNEILIPFYKEKRNQVINNVKPNFKNVKRSYYVGSEWLYFQVYTGVATADKIVKEILGPFSQLMTAKKIIDKWFFVRYADPKFHLRVRFHVKDTKQIGVLISKFSSILEPMLSSKEINDFSIREYKAEIERYGQYTMAESEQIFYLNSILTSAFLACINRNDSEVRVLFALSVIDEFLSAFELGVDDKLLFFHNNRNRLAKQYHLESNKNLKERISTLNRKNKDLISIVLENKDYWKDKSKIYTAIENYMRAITPCARTIRKLLVDHTEVNLHSLLSSHIHMFVNRLMQSENNLFELIIYEYLEKGLKSRIAKFRK